MGSLLYLIVLACAVWVIYDVWTQNKKLTDGNKIVWTVFAIFFSVLTAIVYYFTQKK